MKRRNFVKITAAGSAFLFTSGAFAFSSSLSKRKNTVATDTGGSAAAQQVNDGKPKSSGAYEDMPKVIVKPAPDLSFPSNIDSNSPAHWDGGLLYLFMSRGDILPKRASGPDLFNLSNVIESTIDNDDKFHNGREGARWIEATHKDESGTLYGWYHNEPRGCCSQLKPSGLTVPRIGAIVSKDNGKTWSDLGYILLSPPGSEDCSTPNGYFAGGNGDFSVLLDTKKEFFYFFFSNYWGPVEQQGVAVARMKYADRGAPADKVFKWHQGAWKELGKGGRMTPIFPARSSWHGSKPDVFWGPSVHWNTHLKSYVILMNHTLKSNWEQEGIYVTFNYDISDPTGWSKSQQILKGGKWYPQIIGTGAGETDKQMGRKARFFVDGKSNLEILFLAPGEIE